MRYYFLCLGGVFCLFILLISGCCNDVRWDSLPQGVYLNYQGRREETFRNKLIRSIDLINKQMDMEIFYITDDPNASIRVHLDTKHEFIEKGKSGKALVYWFLDDEINYADVYVNTTSGSVNAFATMIHELWHTLGFLEHKDDESCILFPNSPDAYWLPFCPSMLDDFNDRYPEFAINYKDAWIETRSISHSLSFSWVKNRQYEIQFDATANKIFYPPNEQRPDGASYIFCEMNDVKIFDDTGKDVYKSFYTYRRFMIDDDCKKQANFN